MAKDNKDISKGLAIVLLIVILLVSESIIYYNATQKYGFHIDEIFSFGHANSSEGGFLFPAKISGIVFDEHDIVFNNWTDPDVFWNYLTVQENEVFKYSEISNNLSESVHPPLYYFLLHTVCSFFPETLSKWLGIIPNMVLFSLALIVLFKIGLVLLESRRKSLLICALWGFSIEAVNVAIFIRSYMLLTLLTLLLVLQVVKLYLDVQPKPFRYFFIFLFAILGLLTHYYEYVFLSIFTSVVGIFLWIRNQKKKLLSFVGVSIFAVALSFLISPNIFRHVFSSIRGFESGIRALLGLIAIVGLAMIGLLIYRQRTKNKNSGTLILRDALLRIYHDLQAKVMQSTINEIIFLFLFLTVIFTAILIKLIAPGMDVHSDRYYFNLMPLFFLTGMMLLFSIVKKYKIGNRAQVIISTLLILISFSSNLIFTSAYVFPANENQAELNQEIQDSICLFITDNDIKIHNFSDVFFTAEKVYAAREVSAVSIKNAFSEIENAQKITIIINSEIPQSPDELTILEDQIGYPLQYRFNTRYGNYVYRVYSLSDN